MKEMYFTVVKSEAFREAIAAVANAFGCITVEENGKVNIITFFEGDNEVIKDTLSEVGSLLISEVSCV